MSDRESSAATVLGSFLLGALVGAAVALLTAPKSGRETREDLSRWAQDATEKTREKLGHLQETAEHVRQAAAEKGERARELASEAGERVREFAGEAGERVRRAYSSAKERLSKRQDEEPSDA
ncbi:MAG: YtxH domain-containing protein [Acidobacteriota bacterium]|nr:MAG: YtxH domain-containing protein [Acidobacteriota bacterium]